ncbi:hypothetical protein D3C72_1070250 [compost metagenome]
MQQLQQGNEGRTQPVEDRGVFRQHQGTGPDRHHHRQHAEHHIQGILHPFPRHGAEVRHAVGLGQGTLIAITQHAVLVGDSLLLAAQGSTVAVDILLPGERRQAGHDDGRHHAGQADGQVEGNEHVFQLHLGDHHQTEGDGDRREGGTDDGGFTLGVELALVLLAGEQDADAAIPQPGGEAIHGGATRQAEHRAHDAGHHGADKLQQTEVQQQRQQQAGEDEDGEQHRQQIVQHQATGRPGTQHLGTGLEEGQQHEEAPQYPHAGPEGGDVEQAVEEGASHQDRRLEQPGDQGHQHGSGNDGADHGHQIVGEHRLYQLRQHGDGDGDIAVIDDGGHEQQDPDERRDQKHQHVAASTDRRCFQGLFQHDRQP